MLSSIAKLSSMESFELYVFSFGFAGFDLCSVAARLIVAFEFILGCLLAAGLFHKVTRMLTAVSLGGFSFFLLWRVLDGDTESCHCMGEVVDMNPVQSLLKNIVLALFLALAWNADKSIFRRQVLPAALIAVVGLVSVFMITPPDFFYRAGRTSDDLVMSEFAPVADSLGYSEGRRVVCFYSATCGHCRHCASKMAGIIRRNGLPTDRFSVIFMQTHEKQDSVSADFFRDHGEGLSLDNSFLHPYSFIPMTNGSMPLVVLMEDGNLIKEYDYLSINEREIRDFFIR